MLTTRVIPTEGRASYYPWAALQSLPWLQTIVLLNPLVYMSEGMRVSLTPWVQHMSLWGIFLAPISVRNPHDQRMLAKVA